MTPNRSFSRLAALVLPGLAATLTACVDAPITAPDGATPTRPSLIAASSNGALPALIPNTTKYRSSGKRNGTGRDGGYTLTARALFDRSGLTTLDVTTGELDSDATGPATFAKVQVKGLHPDDLGEALWVRNYNALHKSPLAQYSYTYPGLAPGLPLQVQGNMRGIGKRTGVVTVVEYVKLRPDLAAMSLMAPERATPGLPVIITATVSELNGDVGARADCILYVDGAVADQSNGIWVDAGGTVSCAFMQVFETLGTRALRVAVEGVTPGDWDDGNNSVTGSLEVAFENEFFARGYVRDELEILDEQWDYSFFGSDGTNNWVHLHGYGTHGVSREQQVWFTGRVEKEIAFPFSSIELSERSGNQVLVSYVFSNVQAGPPWGYTGPGWTVRSECSYLFTDQVAAGHVYLDVCLNRYTYSDNTTMTVTEFTQRRNAGDVSYISSEYSTLWLNGVEHHAYVYNYPHELHIGVPIADFAEDRVALRAVFTNASGVHTAAVEVPLTTTSRQDGRPEYACEPEERYTDGSTTYISQLCWKEANTRVLRDGVATALPSEALIP